MKPRAKWQYITKTTAETINKMNLRITLLKSKDRREGANLTDEQDVS